MNSRSLTTGFFRSAILTEKTKQNSPTNLESRSNKTQMKKKTRNAQKKKKKKKRKPQKIELTERKNRGVNERNQELVWGRLLPRKSLPFQKKRRREFSHGEIQKMETNENENESRTSMKKQRRVIERLTENWDRRAAGPWRRWNQRLLGKQLSASARGNGKKW